MNMALRNNNSLYWGKGPNTKTDLRWEKAPDGGTIIHNGDCDRIKRLSAPWDWASDKSPIEIADVIRQQDMRVCGWCKK